MGRAHRAGLCTGRTTESGRVNSLYNTSMSGDVNPSDGRNGYIDLVRGDVPEEIVRFGIGSDPSANVLGTGERVGTRRHLHLVTEDEIAHEPAARRQHPFLTFVSLVLIIAWIVVPAGLIILSRTGTWP